MGPRVKHGLGSVAERNVSARPNHRNRSNRDNRPVCNSTVPTTQGSKQNMSRNRRKWDYELLKVLSQVSGKNISGLRFTIEKLADDLNIELWSKQ